MFKLYSLIFILFITTGCHHNTKPDIVTEYVDRPIYCVSEDELPEQIPYQTQNLSKQASMFEKIQALLIERKQREQVEVELRSILNGCEKE